MILNLVSVSRIRHSGIRHLGIRHSGKHPTELHTSFLFSLRTSRGRVKAVFSQDGKRIINLFFIPHVSEVRKEYIVCVLYLCT